MEQAIAAVLAEYDARAEREEQQMRRLAAGERLNVDDMLLRVGPHTGSFLNLLIKEADARSILEIGASYGYSTIWPARGRDRRRGQGHPLSR